MNADHPQQGVKFACRFTVEREAELKILMEDAVEAPPMLHPSMADRYRKEVARLVDSLNQDDHRTEAASLLRKLVDKIVLKPDPEGSGLLIDLHGDLAGILNMATMKGKPLKISDLPLWQDKVVAGVRNPFDLPAGANQQDKMVAGAGFEPATFRL